MVALIKFFLEPALLALIFLGLHLVFFLAIVLSLELLIVCENVCRILTHGCSRLLRKVKFPWLAH